MKRVIGWQCEACGNVNHNRPWVCPGCRQETCDSCFGSYGHCKACAHGANDSDLIDAANRAGWDFEAPLVKKPEAAR